MDNKQELLKYCYFYKGEDACPEKYNGKKEGKLWHTEKAVCEYFPSVINDTSPRESFAQYVSAYIGKWCPYSLFEIMDVYFEKCPDLRLKLS